MNSSAAEAYYIGDSKFTSRATIAIEKYYLVLLSIYNRLA